MEAASVRALPVVRGETARAAGLAAVAAATVATFAPPGGDSAAHLYRTELLRDGVALWDNFWYGGHYPLASYSLLYYVPASLVGNVPLVAAAAIVSAALFASIAVREWGDAARWPARVFGVLAAGPLFTGTYSYAIGLAAALGALRLLQAKRTWPALAAAALTLGFSPLAFAFLCLALGAVAIGRRPRGVPLVAVGLGAVAAIEVAAVALFPSEGRYPFSPLSLAAVLTVSLLGAALAQRGDDARVLAPFFILWATANVIAFVVPSPFGDNLARLRGLIFPVVLLAALLARFQPRWLALPALAVALVYNIGPDASALPKRIEDRPTATAGFWEPALAFLRARSTPDYRVEVVPTFGHWEAYRLPRAGFPLARGWYRQIDLAENPQLYRASLDGRTYRTWLRSLGVRYVLLPEARLGPMGAEREAELLRSGRAGLATVFRSADWTIYELRAATPILTGPAPAAAALTRIEHERIEGRVGAAGSYVLRVRHSPYLRVAAGPVCVTRADNGMTRLVATEAGRFVLHASLRSPEIDSPGCA
jgi:hypothetical protein